MADSNFRFDVSICADEDMTDCFKVISNSFGHDAPFIDAFFPDHETNVGQNQGYKRLLSWKNTSAQSTFLKATTRAGDGGRERVIGVAIWTFMKEPPPNDFEVVEDVKQFWPDGDDREFMKVLWRKFVIPRSQAVIDSKGDGVYGGSESVAHTGLEGDLINAQYLKC